MPTAKYFRKCPKCKEMIFVGNEIAKTKIEGKIVWVHESCFMPVQLGKEMKSLDADFRRTVGD
jgi:predicted nucleic-acid-binding Zn-ribbon protein